MDRTIALVIATAVALSGTASAQMVDDVGRFCAGNDRRWCEASAADLRREIPQAFKGGYQAQRNVSYCLTTGCDGSIQKNVMLGCAWRLVILASGDSKVNSSDTNFLDVFCARKMSLIERRAADAQASRLFRDVYQRDMVPIPW